MVQRKQQTQGQAKSKRDDPPTVLQLVERQRDPKIVQQLQIMLRDAKAGKIAGVIAAIHYGGREFSYIGSGSMCDCPTLGIASAHKLATKLLHPNI